MLNQPKKMVTSQQEQQLLSVLWSHLLSHLIVVTSLISAIITGMYFKLWYERRRNKDSRPPDDREASIPGDDPYIPTGTTIKMESNPAYATTNY